MQDVNIQQAISDLAIIRQAIERRRTASPTPAALRNVLDANLVLQVAAFVFVLCLIGLELVKGPSIHDALEIAESYRPMALLGIEQIALTLILLALTAYFVVWRASLHAEQPLSVFLEQNFVFLHRFSFLGDLTVKFAVVALVLMSGRALWLTPLLVLFTGDYLIQGRFFTLPLTWSLILGLVCLMLAAVLFFAQALLVVYAFSIFAVVNAISLSFVLHQRLSLPKAAAPQEKE